MAKMAAAVVVAAAATAGTLFYARSKPAPPATVPVRKPSAELPPAIVARAVAEANSSTPAPVSPSPAPAPAPPNAGPVALRPALPSVDPPQAVSGPGAASSLEDLVARVSPTVVVVETSTGRGSGVFVRPDLIVTNAHVAGNDLTFRVRRVSGDTLTARVDTVARDLDLALLRLSTPPADQPIASLGSAAGVRSGQEVVAIGSALGVLQNTVTRGIVSGVRQAGSVTLIQTDAAINPGNSGGPLVDRAGNVIGINTMGVAEAQGISFAVSVDHVRELLGGQHTARTSATPASSLNQTLNARTTTGAGSDRPATAARSRAATTANGSRCSIPGPCAARYWRAAPTRLPTRGSTRMRYAQASSPPTKPPEEPTSTPARAATS
jgi:S1-C subfamily serine protease